MHGVFLYDFTLEIQRAWDVGFAQHVKKFIHDLFKHINQKDKKKSHYCSSMTFFHQN